jgi:hypothetical protein
MEKLFQFLVEHQKKLTPLEKIEALAPHHHIQEQILKQDSLKKR